MKANSLNKAYLMTVFVFGLCLFGAVMPAVAAPGDITTVGGPEARVGSPKGVFVDGAGNLFISASRSAGVEIYHVR